MVFEKLKLEGFAGHDDVRLKTSLRVPKLVVGRIIGKGGKNVRELQRVTGAMVKLPEDPTTQGEEVTVEVFGNFMSIQVSCCCCCGQLHLLFATACMYKLQNHRLKYQFQEVEGSGPLIYYPEDMGIEEYCNF